MANPLTSLPSSPETASRIEACLLDAVRVDDDEYLTEIVSHLIKAGGKRQRPHMTAVTSVAVADGSTGITDSAIRGGVAVELVQVGSLYHDDVMDEAQLRREVDSVNARWGNLRAILAGDYLLAKASEIAADLGVEVAGLLATTIGELCKGQVAELQTLYDPKRTEAAYFQSIAGKTAALFAAATRVGGIVAGFQPSVTDRLTEFGRLYGMAFQVIDDILDVVASDEELGKPAGKDMVEGVYSLPVIHTLAAPGSDELHHLLTDPLHEDDRLKALALVRQGPGIRSAYEVADHYAQQARSAVLEVSDNEAGHALAASVDHLLASVPMLDRQ
jgi:heptaprenyl diphosphate synthase